MVWAKDIPPEWESFNDVDSDIIWLDELSKKDYRESIDFDGDGVTHDQIPCHYLSCHMDCRPPLRRDIDGDTEYLRHSYRPPEKPSHFRSGGHEFAFATVVVMAQLFTQINLGNTIVQSAAIARGLNIPEDERAGQEKWFVASYSITVGAFVLITGRLGDIYGVKNLFVSGWVWMCLFSLLSGLCGIDGSVLHSAVCFDVFRALLGIAPAMLMPNAAALLGTAFQPGTWKKNAAFAALGAVAAGGYVAGTLWAGICADALNDWRWTYWSMAIACVFMVGLAAWLVPSGLNVRRPGSVDWPGAFLGVVSLILIFFAFK